MAIAKVQGPKSAAGASALTATFDSDPTPGNLLLAWGRGIASSYTNGSIPGWTLAAGMQSGATTYMGLWYKVAEAADTTSVVLTWAGETGMGLWIAEYGGFTGTPTLDKTANSTTYTSATSKSSGTTATTTADAELWIAGFSLGNTVTNQAWTNSFTCLLADLSTTTAYPCAYIASATAAAETTMSWTTARVCGGLIATFKGVVTSTWTPKVIMVS